MWPPTFQNDTFLDVVFNWQTKNLTEYKRFLHKWPKNVCSRVYNANKFWENINVYDILRLIKNLFRSRFRCFGNIIRNDVELYINPFSLCPVLGWISFSNFEIHNKPHTLIAKTNLTTPLLTPIRSFWVLHSWLTYMSFLSLLIPHMPSWW